MDIFVLNSNFEKVGVVDTYISFIWTERFNTIGETKLTIADTFENRLLLTPGSMLSIIASKRVMVIETVEKTTDEDGTALINGSGRSLEKILEDRVAWFGLTPTDANHKKWTINADPCQVARTIFYDICIVGVLSPYDVIAGILTTSIFPTDTIDEPTGVGAQNLDPGTLYETMTKLAQAYNFGFRLVRQTDTDQLYFNVYMGVDRTTLQTTHTPIVFSPDLDNIFNINELVSIQDAKNTAFVISDRGIEIVYSTGVDPGLYGLDRKVLFVSATVPEDAVTTYDVTQILQTAGYNALASAQGIKAFDGEVRFPDELVYGTGYNLGDLVELRNNDGNVSYKRVTEYIFVSDSEGERSYPTLTENAIGSVLDWASAEDVETWDFWVTQHWSDFS